MTFNNFDLPYRKSRFRDFLRFLVSEDYTVSLIQPRNVEFVTDFTMSHKQLHVRLFMQTDKLGYGLVAFWNKRWRYKPIIIGDVEDWHDFDAKRRLMFGREG